MATVAELIVLIKGDTTDFEAKMNGMSGIASNLKGAFAAAGFVALAAGITDVSKAAVDFETAFTGVAKTIDGTEQELAGVRQNILDMSKELPVTATEIAKVAEAAGQLGVGLDDITKFTEVMIKFGASTNVSSEDAATAFAKIATVMNTSLSDVDKFASVVVQLGNSMATTEGEILEFANRLSGTASVIGVTEQSVLALSAAASSVGIQAEAGGTAFSTAFQQIFSAISTGGDELKVFASTAGLTVKEFSNLFKVDAVEALLRFSEGVNQSSIEGKDFQAILDAVGLGGVRTSEAILKMGSANDLFRQSQALANAEMKNASALNEEFAKRQETAASNMQLLQNHIEALKITFGDKFLPVIVDFVDAMIPLVDRVGDIVIALDKFDTSLKANQQQSQEWVQGVVDGFNSIDPAINTFMTNVSSKLGDLWVGIGTTAVSSWANIKQKLIDAWSDIKATGSGWFDALKASIDIKWGEIFTGAANSWTNIKGKLVEKWTDIKATGGGWFDALVESINVKWGTIFSQAATSWNNIKAKLVEKWEDIKATGASIFDALVTAIGSAFDRVSAIVTSKWTTIKNAFAKGIEAVKAVLNIGSPSKVFIEIGTEVANGFGIGVTRQLRGFEVPFQEVIPQARGAILGAVNQSGQSTNRNATINLTQNIQSTGDPSEIRRQAELALRRFAIEFPIR